MNDRLNKAASKFAANWCYDINGGSGPEELIRASGEVVNCTEYSGKSIIRIATNVWVFRKTTNGGLIVNYKETHEIEEGLLLKESGPNTFPAYFPGDCIDTSCVEFDLMSKNSESLAHVPAEVLVVAAEMLAKSIEEIGFEEFFTLDCEKEIGTASLYPTIKRVLDKYFYERLSSMKNLDKASSTFDLRIDIESSICVKSGEPVFWEDRLPKSFAIFKIQNGSEAGQMRRAIQYNEWVQKKLRENFTVTSAQGIWQGINTTSLDVIFGISENEARCQKEYGNMACALYIEAGTVPKML